MTHALSCLSETEIAACDGGPGMYGEWTNWSVGSQECPGGISRRFQYYDCGSEPINDWQSLKSELVAQINSLTGHFGQNAVQPVPEPDPDNKLISMALNQSLKPKNAALAVHSSVGHHGVFAVKNVPAVFHLDHVSINVVLFQKKKSKICGHTDYYGLWTSWSQCNDGNGDLVLCGDGLRRRTRTGFCENHDEIQDVDCNTQRC